MAAKDCSYFMSSPVRGSNAPPIPVENPWPRRRNFPCSDSMRSIARFAFSMQSGCGDKGSRFAGYVFFSYLLLLSSITFAYRPLGLTSTTFSESCFE